MNQDGPNFPYRCATCLDTGCDHCKSEPWPKETWAEMTDQDIEQLVCDGMDELQRRAVVTLKLERLWSL
jgi:hypothetical protein